MANRKTMILIPEGDYSLLRRAIDAYAEGIKKNVSIGSKGFEENIKTLTELDNMYSNMKMYMTESASSVLSSGITIKLLHQCV